MEAVVQIAQHRVAGFLGVLECPEWRADDLDRKPVQMVWTPRGQIACASMEARAGLAFKSDQERKAIAICAPCVQLFQGALELQSCHGSILICRYQLASFADLPVSPGLG